MTTVNKLMVGLAVGAVLGVLYAPDKGSITRRKLSRTGNDIRDKFNNFKDAINDRIDSLKEDVDDLADEQLAILDEETTVKPVSWQ